MFDQSKTYISNLNIINQSISFIFIVNTFLKLLAYGFIRYIGDFVRKVELIITLISLTDLILDLLFNWT